MSQNDTHDWKTEIANLRNEIRGIADELKVKLHLAGMDAKDAWNKVEPKIYDFEKRAETVAQTTAGELKGAAQSTASDLKEVAKDLRDRLQKIRDSF